MATTLTGNPKTILDNDDGFVYPHDVKAAVPNLDADSYAAVRSAIVAHTSRGFNLAIDLYQRSRNARLTTGEIVDLFEIIPGLKDVNFRWASEGKTGEYLA